MLDRFADWLDRQAPGRRRLYSVFIALALLTIPCYASATLLWFFDIPGTGPSSTGEDVENDGRSEATATLAIPTLGSEDDAPEPPAPAPTDRPREEKDPEPTLAPRPTDPPLPTATDIIFPTPILRASPSAQSSATPAPSLEPTTAPTSAPTEAPTETEAPPEPTEEPTAIPVIPSPTPPIQVTLDP